MEEKAFFYPHTTSTKKLLLQAYRPTNHKVVQFLAFEFLNSINLNNEFGCFSNACITTLVKQWNDQVNKSEYKIADGCIFWDSNSFLRP